MTTDPIAKHDSTIKSSRLHTETARLKARQARADRSAALMATHQALALGVEVYQDSPPGVGWVLARTGLPNKYLATRELAIAHWHALEQRSV